MQATYITGFGSCAVDTFFYACAFNLSGHLKALQYRIENLNFGEKHDESIGRIKISHELKETIQYHTKIIDLCNDLTSLYKPVIFIQLLVSSLQICVLAYQFTLVNIDEPSMKCFMQLIKK